VLNDRCATERSEDEPESDEARHADVEEPVAEVRNRREEPDRREQRADVRALRSGLAERVVRMSCGFRIMRGI